jgi:hypothetical protein
LQQLQYQRYWTHDDSINAEWPGNWSWFHSVNDVVVNDQLYTV